MVRKLGTIKEEYFNIVEYNIVEEELGLTWIAADEPTRDLERN